jgi:hypothetical protein
MDAYLSQLKRACCTLVTSDPHPLNGLANKMADRPMVIPYSH